MSINSENNLEQKKDCVNLLKYKSIVFIFLLFLFDQVTKIFAVNALSKGNSIPIIEGALELFYIKNTGAAFSFLTGQTWVFILFTPIITAFIVYFYVKLPRIKRFLPLRVLCIFVIAGALGNFYDRIFLGYVRDFIYFSLIDFPVFNVADIYVTCSVFIFAFLFIFYYKEEDFDDIFPKKTEENNKGNMEK